MRSQRWMEVKVEVTDMEVKGGSTEEGRSRGMPKNGKIWGEPKRWGSHMGGEQDGEVKWMEDV